MLQGAANARDTGGLPTAGGGRVVPGVLLRSEALGRLTDADVERLRDLGLRSVYDLRTSAERETQPNRELAIEGLTTHVADSDHAVLAGVQAQIGLALRHPPEKVHAVMVELYRTLPEAFAPTVAAAVVDISDGRPILVHCAAGKDRTGFVVAVLLLAAGVTTDAGEADYLASNVGYSPGRIAAALEETFGHRAPEETVRCLGVLPEYLRAAFEAVDRGWGSVEAYLAAAGVTPDRLAAFRERLVGA